MPGPDLKEQANATEASLSPQLEAYRLRTDVSEARLRKRLLPLTNLSAKTLMVHEVYASIQGESSYAGLPCTFVRTTGCHMRCAYCDTRHAFAHGQTLTVDGVLARVRELAPKLVEITGGEPLLQAASLALMARLCDAGYTVLLETSGSLDIGPVDARVIRIVDLKTPSSGEADANLYGNMALLQATDELKLVIGSREDYEWGRRMIQEHSLAGRCSILMGAAFGRIEPQALAAWILDDALPVRLQVQLHKVLWSPEARGV